MNLAALRHAALPFISPGPYPLPFDPTFFDQLPLHDFQFAMLLKLVELVRAGYRRILLQLPTGGGKTFLATAMLGGADGAHFVVHRKELIEQTSRSFWAAGIAHSFVASGKPMDLDAALLLCGINTLASRLGVVLPAPLVVVDECHHSVSATWAAVLAEYPDAIIVGLTATPERLDGRGLDDQFDVMIEGPSTAELIARGFLSPFDYYAPSLPDMTGANTDAAAAAIMDRPTLIGDMVEHYLRLAPGKPGIVFASSLEHSRHLVDAFRGNGVRAMHVDGDLSEKERTRADAMFRAGDVDVLSNCSLFGEGYDVPGIVYCGLGRRTKSLSLYRQMCGRDLRVVYAPGMPRDTDAERLAAIAAGPKPRGILCDHAGNVFHHGMPDDHHDWTLAGRVRGSRAAGCNDDATPVHQCLVCYRVTPSTVTICPGCETPFPAQVRVLRQEAGTLTKVEREALKRAATETRKAEERACRSEGELIALGEARGYEYPRQWAKRQIAQRSAWRRGG